MKKLISSILVGVLLLSSPLSNLVLCLESDGHSNIEYSVIGTCEKSLCALPQDNSTPDGHKDSCENCTDTSLSPDQTSLKKRTQTFPKNAFIPVSCDLDHISHIKTKPTSTSKIVKVSSDLNRNAYLVKHKTIVLLI